MRTTVDLPDDLYRQVKSHAALQGRAVRELVMEGLELVLRGHQPAQETPIAVPATPRPARAARAVVPQAEEESMETKLL